MNAPQPSWFANQGIPFCSKWGKSEIEHLAWAYVAAQARDGDTWHAITPEKAYELLTEEERRIVGGFKRENTLHPAYLEWWAMIGHQLRDANGAFEIAGLAWSRWKFNRENIDSIPPVNPENPAILSKKTHLQRRAASPLTPPARQAPPA